MTEREDIEMLAAEYVLGTLDADERSEVDVRRMREAALDTAIGGWERRLSPLIGSVQDVMPPPGLLSQIHRRMDEQPVPVLNGAVRTHAPDNRVVDLLQRRLARWRTGAFAASALAACLAGAIVLRETIYPPVRQEVMGVFQKDDGRPSFLLTIDLKTREVLIRPVHAERLPGKSYQLWIVSDRLGPGPRSLGLLNADLEPTRKRLGDFDSDLLRNALFGISLEPTGGSPTGKPTGPALHSKLYPADL